MKIANANDNPQLIKYLQKNEDLNRNTLNYLTHDPNAEVYFLDENFDKGAIIGNKEKNFFSFATRDINFIEAFWDTLPPGEKVFSAVPKDIALSFIAGKETTFTSHVKVFVLKDVVKFEKFAKTVEDSSQYDDDVLHEEDATEVDMHYTLLDDEHSLPYIRGCILLKDSSCIRVNGELVAWCLVHSDDNALGPLYVKEAFRRSDFAKLVSVRVMKKVLAKGITPYWHVVETNNASISLTNKIDGMEFTHDATWFGLNK